MLRSSLRPGSLRSSAGVRVHTNRRDVHVNVSKNVEPFLELAAQKLARDDRIGAIRQYEKALEMDEEDMALDDRVVLLYNLAAIQGSIGDVELSQVPLRDAITRGLDFEDAMVNPKEGMVKWKSSQQVRMSMTKFAKTISNFEAKPGMAYNPTKGLQLTPGGMKTALESTDVGDILGADMTGIDTSLLGVVKRVALLLVILIGFGAALFYLGLETMFPK